MILEPERGMRTSHCSKTYQLGPLGSANSACFRHFLRLITGFAGFSVPDSATSGRSLPQFPSHPCDALSLDVGFRGTLHQSMWGSPGPSISRCGVPRDAPSVDAGFPGTLHQLMRGSTGRSISRCGVRRDAPSVDAGFPGTLYQLMSVVGGSCRQEVGRAVREGAIR